MPGRLSKCQYGVRFNVDIFWQRRDPNSCPCRKGLFEIVFHDGIHGRESGEVSQEDRELYNLVDDPAELNDISEQHPEIIRQAAEIFEREHQNSSVERFRIPLIEEGLLGGVED